MKVYKNERRLGLMKKADCYTTKQEIYDDMIAILSDFETKDGSFLITEVDLYNMLNIVAKRWQDLVRSWVKNEIGQLPNCLYVCSRYYKNRRRN